MLDQSIAQGTHAASRSVVYLYPENLETYHRQVRETGLDVPDLTRTFYGMTEFRLQDPDGNQVWIGETTPSSGTR